MACMKCGKDTEGPQMFCAHCLEVMEAYPVKPDVHIQLPVRQAETTSKKQTRKRIPKKDAQIAVLRLQLRLLWVVVAALVLALVLLMYRGALALL